MRFDQRLQPVNSQGDNVQANNSVMRQLIDRFHLERVKDAAFFPEWQTDLPELNGMGGQNRWSKWWWFRRY